MSTPLMVDLLSRRRLGLSLALAGALAWANVDASRAEVIYVGTAAACDEDTLPLALLRAALNGEPADEIRLPRDTTYTNVSLHLTDWSPAMDVLEPRDPDPYSGMTDFIPHASE